MAYNFKNSNYSILFSVGFIAFAVIIYFVVTITGVFVPVVENASKYAQVGREIVDNSDWINLTIAHEPYDQKPPLLFWIGALTFSVFGFSVPAYKLSVLLLSFIGIFATFKLGSVLYGRKTGALAAFFWATSLGYFYFHNDIHTDSILVNFVILAIWQLTLFFKEKKWHQYLLGVVSLGLAMLAKGPVGLAIPVFALGTHLLVQKKTGEIFHVRWLLAVIIVLIIVSPALIGLYKQFGFEGLKFYFWTNNVGRVTGSYRTSNSDPTFYFHNLILVGLPWFAFIYAGLILEIRKFVLKIKRKEPISGADETITLGGIVLFFIILTIASQKNPHYLMSILPLIMILSAKWALKIFKSNNYLMVRNVIAKINLVFIFLMLLIIALFVFWFYPEKQIWYWILFAGSLIILTYFIFRKKGLVKQVLMLLTIQFLFFISLNVSILPSMFKYYSTFKACEIFNAEAVENEVLHSYRLRYWSLFTYSKNYGNWITEDDDIKGVLKEKKSWIFTDEYGRETLDLWDVSYSIKGQFLHRNLTGQTIQFLNPKTREKHLLKYYLVKLE